MISRRNFLKLLGLGIGGLPLIKLDQFFNQVEFPQAEKLGRACATLDIKLKPDLESPTIGILYEDSVVPWIREVSGTNPAYIFNNQRWVEIPEGYVYAPYLQPVKNQPNKPVESIASSSIGPGMWGMVTIPYADIKLVNKPTSNSWVSTRLEKGQPLRIYYGQIFWIDKVEQSQSGQYNYHINPNYYGGLDRFIVSAEAMCPIFSEDITPIHPQAEEKKIQIDVVRQCLSCFEGSTEVYFCKISSGAKFDMYGNPVDKWATPIGKHRVTRKFISLQMSGGTTGAPYDLPGIGWVVIFATGGVAIHSTFWHNNFGDTMSHGCVNVLPEDAQWIFRWTTPEVQTDPGMVDITITGQSSTTVEVIEG